MRPPPLSGNRVLDLTRLLPGPLCTQHLADMGADVIKIEDTHTGDYARTMRGYFDLVNRNKRSMKLDLKSEQGRSTFLKLSETADVIVEGFRPGVVDRLGVGYDVVRRVNEKIVYCALTGYGQTGPFQQQAGHDLNYCSYNGITEQNGVNDAIPTIPNLQIADLLGGTLSAVMGILAGLVDAKTTGRGRYVDVAMADCSLAHSIMALMDLNERGRPDPRGTGMLSGGLPWYSIYETADKKYVALGALENKFWVELCSTLGRPEWSDQQSASPDVLEQIRNELKDLFATQTQAYWIERFEKSDCCFSPVLSLDQTVKHEQFLAREMFAHNDERIQYAFPVKFNDYKFEVKRQAPEYGEHTEELLSELGYSFSDIADLKTQGVI
ncbi:MAG: CaiB/BaiF CoA-transferase family protein [Arenicellales bacterium]|nr:CaiB/BaiF CoA-transferase family protein [Arenicellales bacterium]